MVRHEQQLRISVVRRPVERVQVRRRVVIETRMVPVQVRREVLDIERTPIDGTAGGDDVAGAAAVSVDGPLVVVLREEVPVVSMTIRPVERVRISVRDVSTATIVTEELNSEQIDVSTVSST